MGIGLLEIEGHPLNLLIAFKPITALAKKLFN